MLLSKLETFVDITISSLHIYLALEAVSDRLVCDKPTNPNVRTVRHTYGRSAKLPEAAHGRLPILQRLGECDKSE